MVFIRDIRKTFIAICIMWVVLLAAIFIVCHSPNKNEIITEPIIETKVVYITQYKYPDTYYSSISITEEDCELLSKLVYLEARNQPKVGQRAVVEVVLNRVLDSRFPNTVYDVIYQNDPVLQFSTSPSINDTTPTQEQYDVVDIVLNETTPILDTNTIYFSKSPQTKNVTAIINDHYFCK